MAAVLRDRGISFCVIGAAAMAVHGVARSTQDVDLLVVAPESLDATTWEPLRRDGIAATPHRGDATDPLQGVVRVRGTSPPPVDVVVGKARWHADVVARASMASIEGVDVPVARTADLVLLKLYAAGPQDAWDIVQLLDGPDRSDVLAEVERGLADLPDDSRALWRRIVSGA